MSLFSLFSHHSTPKTSWSMGQALVTFATGKPSGPWQAQIQSSFLVFFLLMLAWFLGESIPSDET